MFSSRPRRNVNLGNRNVSTAHDALKNAEVQRQKREKLRQETKACRTIQKRWRATVLLRQLRCDFAHTLYESANVAPPSSEEIAWILPIFASLNKTEQLTLLQSFLDSKGSRVYSQLLIERVYVLWTIPDQDIHALGFRVLQDQSPQSIPPTLMMRLMKLTSSSDELIWIAQRDPFEFLKSLLDLQDCQIIVDLPQEALTPLFDLEALPPNPDKSGLLYREIIERLKPFSADAFGLLSRIITAIDRNHIPNFVSFSSELFNRQLIGKALQSNPLALAEYSIALQNLYPMSKPEILLQLSLASNHSALRQLWVEYKTCRDEIGRASLLHIITELYSYWLLVATDAELVGKSSLGFDLETLKEYVVTIRDKVFELLWSYKPGQRVKTTGVMTAVIKVLRQLYTRDSRMHLFPEGFWLMSSITQANFLQNFDTAKPQFGNGRVAQQSDDTDESEDEDLFEDQNNNARKFVTDEVEEQREPYSDKLKDTKLMLRRNPALRILEHAPFFVPFQTRAALFYRFIASDRESQPAPSHMLFHFEIDRDKIVEDARHAFASLGPRLKTELQVRLISNGSAEAGVDGGGLRRELLMQLCEKVFFEQLHEPRADSKPPYFIETANHTISPNPVYGEKPELLEHEDRAFYSFAGQIIGKCLYENLLVDVEFAPFFMAKWNKQSVDAFSARSSFDDLFLLDEELYKNISKLHNIHGADTEALGLDFTVVNSQRELVELRPNGATIPVTDANKLEYMRELANYKLNKSLGMQTKWFMFGLSQVIRLEWLNMFNTHELNKLISGEARDYSIEDLKRNSVAFDFREGSRTLEDLWEVLEEFNPQQRAEFLRFITSVPKAPLLGFSRLEPHLGIRCVGLDDRRLPTAATCLNLLKLPEYSSKALLREKLLYSINAKAGFELS